MATHPDPFAWAWEVVQADAGGRVADRAARRAVADEIERRRPDPLRVEALAVMGPHED